MHRDSSFQTLQLDHITAVFTDLHWLLFVCRMKTFSHHQMLENLSKPAAEKLK